MPRNFPELLPTLVNIAFHSGSRLRLRLNQELREPLRQRQPLCWSLVLDVLLREEACGKACPEAEVTSVCSNRGNLVSERRCRQMLASGVWCSHWHCNFCKMLLTTAKTGSAPIYAFNYLDDYRGNSQNLKNFTFARYKFLLPLERTTLPFI